MKTTEKELTIDRTSINLRQAKQRKTYRKQQKHLEECSRRELYLPMSPSFFCPSGLLSSLVTQGKKSGSSSFLRLYPAHQPITVASMSVSVVGNTANFCIVANTILSLVTPDTPQFIDFSHCFFRKRAIFC